MDRIEDLPNGTEIICVNCSEKKSKKQENNICECGSSMFTVSDETAESLGELKYRNLHVYSIKTGSGKELIPHPVVTVILRYLDEEENPIDTEFRVSREKAQSISKMTESELIDLLSSVTH